jgi:NAD(P)-dependent dehydrogenase (short-subunit alcohol dehydrogenase family)
MRFAGKTAFVTGAASGIGRTAAIRLAMEGARIFGTDINENDLISTLGDINDSGGVATGISCDISDELAVRKAVDQAMEAFGSIDILVNVAGIQITKLLVDTTYEEYKRMMDINMGGSFLTMNAILPIMKKAGGGAVVNVASELAMVGYPHLAAYTSTKGAMVAMSRSASLEAIKYGVRINCVCPGATDTPIFWEGETDPVRRKELLDQVAIEKPIGRLITTDEVTDGIIFLASGEASGIVGACLVIDGGFTAQ